MAREENQVSDLIKRMKANIRMRVTGTGSDAFEYSVSRSQFLEAIQKLEPRYEREYERIAELEAKIRADRTKDARVRAFAALCLSVEEDPEYPFTKKELKKALQYTIDGLRKIAMDKLPGHDSRVQQEIENE